MLLVDVTIVRTAVFETGSANEPLGPASLSPLFSTKSSHILPSAASVAPGLEALAPWGITVALSRLEYWAKGCLLMESWKHHQRCRDRVLCIMPTNDDPALMFRGWSSEAFGRVTGMYIQGGQRPGRALRSGPTLSTQLPPCLNPCRI
jgi:hypothetical protein